jgi:hypothetical protein
MVLPGTNSRRRSSEDMRVIEETNPSEEYLVSTTERVIKGKKATKKRKKERSQSTRPGNSVVGESSSTIQKFVEFSKAIEPEKSPSFGAGWMGVDWAYQSPVKKTTHLTDGGSEVIWKNGYGWQKPLYKPRVASGGAVVDFRRYPTKITFGPDPNLPSREEMEEDLRKQKRQLELDIMFGGRTVAVPNGITRGMDYSLYGDDYPTPGGAYVQSGSTVGGKPMIANKDAEFVKSENAALLGQVALYLDHPRADRESTQCDCRCNSDDAGGVDGVRQSLHPT